MGCPDRYQGAVVTEREYQEELLELFLDLHEKLVLTTEAALQDGRFKNLSRNDLKTLKAIGLHGEKTMGETAQELRITLGTLTVAINKLVKKGYVQRHRASEDQRRVLLNLTREGQVALRLFRKFNRVLMQRVLNDISDAEQRMFYEFLSNMNDFMMDQYLDYKARKIKEREDGQAADAGVDRHE